MDPFEFYVEEKVQNRIRELQLRAARDKDAFIKRLLSNGDSAAVIADSGNVSLDRVQHIAAELNK